MRGPVIIWLLFISWLVHDLEEILFFYQFDYQSDRRISQVTNKWPIIRPIISSISASQREMLIATAIMGFFLLGATAAGYYDPLGFGFFVYAIFLGGYFLHAFTHLGQSIIIRKYTPGVISAIIIVMPASIFIYTQLFLLGRFTFGEASISGLIGLIIFIPLVIIVHRIVQFICRNI